MGAYKKHEGRKYFFDMTNIKANYTFLHANAKSREKYRQLRQIDPYAHYYGQYRKYRTPKDLERHINRYFEKCMTALRDKEGNVVYDSQGNEVMVQSKPFTISGMASFLGITTGTLRTYHIKAKAGLIDPEYARVIIMARQKIEEFAESQLYTKDGSRGGEFVLRAGFGWQTKSERKLDKMNKKKLKMQMSESKLKQQALEMGADGDNKIEIRITRADKQQENSDEDDEI